jgi:hypothetical protein
MANRLEIRLWDYSGKITRVCENTPAMFLKGENIDTHHSATLGVM